MKHETYNNRPYFTSDELVKWFENEATEELYRKRDDGSKSITLSESFYVDGTHYTCGATIYCDNGSITVERSQR